MELDKLEALLLKYDEGETTLEEEAQLRTYFATAQVPEHLMAYKSMFAFAEKAKTIKYTGNKVYKESLKTNYYRYTGLAAGILLLVSLFTYQNYIQKDFSSQELGTVQDPKEAYKEAKKTLQMISEVMNNSQEDLVYMQEFNKTKNKFIKKQ